MILKRAIYWGLPSFVCVALYWHGLKAWFQMDDFAWLSLHTQVRDFPSLISTLFRPMAQGTVRPLSERLFFLSFWQMFGMDALPYRALVFATQFANLALLAVIVRRLTGSAIAGLAAPLLWLASPVLYLPMVWTSAYNQILCTFFLLSAFLLLLRYIDHGRRLHYAGMWLAFLLGFGALELNVVFPAVACLYTGLFSRPHLRAVAPMFAVSLVYAAWHRSISNAFAESAYAMDYNPVSLIRVLAQYIWLSVSATERLVPLPPKLLQASSIAVLLALAAFLAVMAWKRQRLAIFFAGWFLVTLALYLPLAKHVSDYYLTVPAIGLAMLGGWAISLAANGRASMRAVTAAAVLLFAIPCGWHAWSLTEWYSAKSRRVRTMVRGIASAHARHPDRWIVLHGVDNDLFWNGLYDKPEAALGWRPLYMTAETQSVISPVLDEDVSDRFLPSSVTLEAIRNRQAMVYDVSGGRLRNITTPYAQLEAQSGDAAALPWWIDAGNPLFASFLKEGWYGITGGMRWTSQRAVLQMGRRGSGAAGIRVRGNVTGAHTATQPLRIALTVNGASIGAQSVPPGGQQFDLTFPIPQHTPVHPPLLITIETDRTVSLDSDRRTFGLAMGTVAVVPFATQPGVR